MRTKNFFHAAALMLGLACTGFMAAACSDDDNNGGNGDTDFDQAANLDYTAANSANWLAYSVRVANLLEQDATSLYDAWETSYDGGAPFKEIFKAQTGGRAIPT